jgi:hypothetical protein
LYSPFTSNNSFLSSFALILQTFCPVVFMFRFTVKVSFSWDHKYSFS